MFNWMVKVVPHPPDGQDSLEKAPATVNGKTSNRVKLKSSKSIREEDQTSQTSQGSVQNGMINWLSNGFASALPQPASPLLSRANSDAKSMHDEGSADRTGVINWISQGIGKVVPQPDEKYRQGETPECQEVTEVYDVKELPDYEPLPHIPVVEMVSEDEATEVDTPQFPPKIMNWIKSGFQNALPQHVVRPPNNSNDSSPRSSQCSNKVFSPPPESITSVTEVDLKATSMVGRIVQGLGLSMPQPVLKNKEGYMEDREILQNGSVNSVPADFILEEVDSEDEAQPKEAFSEQPAKTPADLLSCPEAGCQPQIPISPEQSLQLSVAAPSQTHTELEDAETQTARWTPMIESIKREAEDTAILIMEERLMQERLEMTRMAEEVARQTAEMAVRELARARLGIQTIVEEPEDVDQE
ncbi:uncharacterized protein [Misgurnus anguillicaudatus]|uniref:uncharacterized protein n=1 Tax=Misgurnus anguillicaudatus TaxID=75329 RepID=UPI003CCF2C3E